jgi:hypothetical protein
MRKPIVKKANRFVPLAIAALVLGLTTQSSGTQQHEVVEKMNGHGGVNWSQGIIYAKGIGRVPEEVCQAEQNPSTSKKAEEDAYANLFRTVKEVRIDSSARVKDLVEKSDMIRVQLQGMVKGAQMVKREYLSDGTVDVTLALKLTGGLTQLALPEYVRQVRDITPISGEPSGGNEPENEPPQAPSTVYTGLVLDARGLQGQPAMAPVIVDENGREVYGSAYVSREFAVQHGMAAYDRDLKTAQNNPRVSNQALAVRALRTIGPSGCNFVISNADAWKIQNASENLLFLKKCRVIIVLD